MKCNYCKNEKFENLISATNSMYHYCASCNNDFVKVNKHLAIDAVLKELLHFLKTSNKRKMKIEVIQKKELILLYIDDKKVFATHLTYKLTNKDIYYLENTINELAEDFYDFNLEKVDIVVCA